MHETDLCASGWRAGAELHHRGLRARARFDPGAHANTYADPDAHRRAAGERASIRHTRAATSAGDRCTPWASTVRSVTSPHCASTVLSLITSTSSRQPDELVMRQHD